MKRLIFAAMLSLTIMGLAFGANQVHAQPYPSRPIQLIIPNVPGSIMDINSRILSEGSMSPATHVS